MASVQERSNSESAPLLIHSNTAEPPHTTTDDGEAFDDVPRERRQLGLASAVFLVFNKIIGTGIYATPATILVASDGVIAVSFIMWLVGAAIAMSGTAVYVELGTGLPRSGGEKNYLEYIYRRPLYLVTCVFTFYTLIMGSAAANSIVFGEYLANAISPSSSSSSSSDTTTTPPLLPTLLASAALLLTPLIHGLLPVSFGLRLQNLLGVIKFFVLASMAFIGGAIVLGVPGLGWDGGRGSMTWTRIWESWEADVSGESGKGVWSVGWNGFVSGLFNVIWSYIGYSNANYALSEIRNPVRTIKIAGPLAVGGVTLVYLCINMAYFGVVRKEEFLEMGRGEGKGRIVAALFFRNLFGAGTERALSLFIALSTLGNILTGQFVQARVIQELGRSGILPFSSFFASNKPAGLPFAGLCTQALISMMLLVGVPKGDAYTAIISTSSYSLSLVNMFVSAGLLLLTTSFYKSYARSWSNEDKSAATDDDETEPLHPVTSPVSPCSIEHAHSTFVGEEQEPWNPPFKAYRWAVLLFLVSNVFLVVVPFVPPSSEQGRVYRRLPYWTHPVASCAVSLIGLTYWYFWARWVPRKKGYRLVRREVVDGDGVSRFVFDRVKP